MCAVTINNKRTLVLHEGRQGEMAYPNHRCPDCGGPLVHGEGCVCCPICGFTRGCKLNQAESEAIARDLTAAGCRVTDAPAAVDAFVINTCAVTHVAARKSRHLVRLPRPLSPQA